ncbi:MAG TPA: tetratricopeptide repeat protein [Blastocatellia bacterium]|nr:tetratricopeptide repeat protein [Blastocatellia bacterium]
MSRYLQPVLLTLLVIPMAAAIGPSPLQKMPGLVIEVVTADGPAAKAGLKVGDRILTYDGKVPVSPSALQAAEENTFGQPELVVQVRRGEETRSPAVPPGSLGIKARPELPAAMLQPYQEGSAALQAQKPKEAIERWGAAVKAAPESEQQSAAWIYGRIGEVHEGQNQWRQALEAYTAAWKILKESGDAAARSRMLTALGRANRSLSDLAAVESCWEEARKIDAEAGNEMWVAGDLNNLGSIAFYRTNLQGAQDYYRRALAIGERLAPDSLVAAASLNGLGNITSRHGDAQTAQDYYRRALVISERLNPDSLEVANSLNGLGVTASQRGDLQAAQDYYHRVLAIKERLVPDSLSVAGTLRNLGNLARARGDLDAALDYYRRALVIQERLSPGSLDVAGSFNNLGVVARQRGDLQAAQDYHNRALAIEERLSPGSLDVAGSFNNLGVIARQGGDLQAAEDYFRRALAIKERVSPGSLDVASSLNNLGNLARDRGDLQAAEDYHRRALTIKERLAPDSIGAAVSLDSLGLVAQDHGDLQTANLYFGRALTIKERLAPDSLEVADSLRYLGFTAQKRGDLPAAQDYYRRSLKIRERLAPDSIEVADSLGSLGDIARKSGDLQTAEDHYRRVMAIRERIAPQALYNALVLTQLGNLAFNARRLSDARASFDRAVAIVESQRRAIFSNQARGLLLAQYQESFSGLLRTYLALDDRASAFATFERARARSLTDLFAERKVDLQTDAPADLLGQQQQLDQDRSAAYAVLTKLNPRKDGGRIDQLRTSLAGYDVRQRELEAQFRRASPRFASLQYPEPLDLPAAQATLDEGTLLLAYYVDENETYLFAVTRTGVKVSTLPLGEAELTKRVNAFRETVSQKRLGNPLREVQRQGSQLYDDLIRPGQELVNQATRILICPDGPLHILPFAALVSRTGPKLRYFVEDRPIHTIASMTVYAEAQKSLVNGGPQTKPAVLAFGDAIYTRAQASVAADQRKPEAQRREGQEETVSPDPLMAGLRQRGWNFGPLPGTRREVEAIAGLYGSAATIRLGQAATKLAAQRESPNYPILHFAVHGWLDDQIGLNSGLAFSQPEASGRKAENGDNGLWQAWEIFGQTRVKADLVVLSACLTGLGQEVKSEGIIGLTRAFQYAGARSVVVSLWSVSDQSTAELMSAFYRELHRGAAKDLALQKAMVAVRGNPRWAHPYYWSAFILSGDWRSGYKN